MNEYVEKLIAQMPNYFDQEFCDEVDEILAFDEKIAEIISSGYKTSKLTKLTNEQRHILESYIIGN